MYQVDYEAISRNGDALWNRILGVRHIGRVWTPGIRKPLSFQQAKATKQSKEQLVECDPLSQAAIELRNADMQRELVRGGTSG